jgi:hypothetical protein
MHNTTKALALAMIAFFCWASTSEAAFFSFPRALKFQVEQISFNGLALVPVAHTRFCPQYRDDRETEGVDLGRRNIALTAER